MAGGFLLVAGIVIAVAPASTSTKFYTVSAGPTTLTQLQSTAFSVTLGNHATSTQTLGSANITLPTGVTVVGGVPGQVTSSDGKLWNVGYAAVSRTIELRAVTSRDAISPAHTVTAPVTVVASCIATTAPLETIAKQANNFSGSPGNNFQLFEPAETLTIAPPGAGATKLAFVQQPTRTQVNTSIAPAVTVEALDACDNRVTDAAGIVALAIGTNPSGGVLTDPSGPPTVPLAAPSKPLVSGVATFASLQIDKSGEGYTLVASSAGRTDARSAEFEVVDRLCLPDDPEGVCQSTDIDLTTTVITPLPSGDGSMSLRFTGLGADMDCGGTIAASRGSVAIIDPDGYSEAIPITMRWTKEVAPGTGVANFVFCMSKDPEKDGYTVPVACTKKGALPANEPFCELKRSRNGVGELVIQFLIHPTDPWAGAR